MIIVDVLAITSLQRDLPGDVLGRVLGVFDTVVLAGILLASLAAGVLLAHSDVNVALVAVGVGIPALGLVGLPTLLRADRTSAAAAERLRPRVELLSELDLLAGADRRTLERLAAAAEEIAMPAGQVVIRQGDEADALWILADGELSVQASGDGPEPRELAPVTAPGYVGELGLLHGIPRTASVRTLRPSTLLRIGGQDFLSALQVSQPSPSLLSVAGTRMARTPWLQPPAAAQTTSPEDRTMNPDELLRQLGELATSLGPAVRPAGTDELLRSLTETARRLFGAAACSLALLSEDESELVYTVAAGQGADDVTGMRIPASQGIAGWVVQSGQPIAVSDVASDPRFAREQAEQTGYIPQAILAVPVETPARLLGVISLLDRDPRRPGAEQDMALLSLFADQAALALASVERFSLMGRVLLDALADRRRPAQRPGRRAAPGRREAAGRRR